MSNSNRGHRSNSESDSESNFGSYRNNSGSNTNRNEEAFFSNAENVGPRRHRVEGRRVRNRNNWNEVVRNRGFVRVMTENPGRRLYAHINPANPKQWIPIELGAGQRRVTNVLIGQTNLPGFRAIPAKYVVHRRRHGYRIEELRTFRPKKYEPKYIEPPTIRNNPRFVNDMNKEEYLVNKERNFEAMLYEATALAKMLEKKEKEQPLNRFRRAAIKVKERIHQARDKTRTNLRRLEREIDSLRVANSNLRETKRPRAYHLAKRTRSKRIYHKHNPTTRYPTRSEYLGVRVAKFQPKTTFSLNRFRRAVERFEGAKRERRSILRTEGRPEFWTSVKPRLDRADPWAGTTMPKLRALIHKYEPGINTARYNTRGKLSDKLVQLYLQLVPDEEKVAIRAPPRRKRETERIINEREPLGSVRQQKSRLYKVPSRFVQAIKPRKKIERPYKFF